MVDPGEAVAETVKREFQEETLRNGVDKASLDAFFSDGTKVYQSYSDDPRNTDNAWMETVAM
jgi:transient receptor potential cation channel subfamily M member 2